MKLAFGLHGMRIAVDRKCSSCGSSKTVISQGYAKWRNIPEGIVCSRCFSNWLTKNRPEVRSRYMKKYHETHFLANRKFRAKTKLQVLTHYGNGKASCVKCGFDDIWALQLDHINGRGGIERKSVSRRNGLYIYMMLKRERWPKGYQTLCANCNTIKKFANNEFGGRFRRT